VSPYLFHPVLKNGVNPSTGKLFRNDWNGKLGHPVFTDVSKEAGIQTEGYSHSALITDINNDGWKDIYVGNDFLTNDLLWINNGDGTFTTIYDYGDGCDEFGYLAKGKITYIWKNVGNDYYSKVLYDHYYNYGMEMNGYSEYSFISDGNSYFEYDSAQGSKDSLVSPGIVFYWSGTSTGKDDISIVYDNGEKYTYTSNYSNKWDNSTYTVLEGEYTCISEPDGYEYHYLVTTPLFYNYACTNTWVAVSGVETIHYKDVAESYDFLIDYGNGNCDNLATITENGETSVVDFGELIYEYCGEDVVSDSTTAYPGR